MPVIIEGELAISIMEVFDFLNLERRFSVSCSGLSEIRGGSDGLGFSDVSGVDDEVSQRTSTSDGAVSSSLPSNIDSNSMVGVADPLNTERQLSVNGSDLSVRGGGSDSSGPLDILRVDDEVSQRTSTSDGAVSSSLSSNIDSNSVTPNRYNCLFRC